MGVGHREVGHQGGGARCLRFLINLRILVESMYHGRGVVIGVGGVV